MVYLLQQVINLGLKISWWEPIDPSTIDESILSCVFPSWPLVTFFHALSTLIPKRRIPSSVWNLGPAWPSLALWKQISWFCLRRSFGKKSLSKFHHALQQTWMSSEVKYQGCWALPTPLIPMFFNGELWCTVRLGAISTSTGGKPLATLETVRRDISTCAHKSPSWSFWNFWCKLGK